MATIDIRKPLKKYIPHLLKAQADNLNEADTVQRIIKVFEDVLGYDPMTDITRETSIKDRYCDVALKVDGTIRILVEAKSAATVLRDRHTEQALNYAAHANIPWVLLTNGVNWNLYHLTFGEGIEPVLAFSVELSDNLTDKGADLFSLLHRQNVKRDALEEYWVHRIALSPASVAKALFTEDVLKLVRRELRKLPQGILVDEEDIAAAIHEMFSPEARERIGPLKIRRKNRAARPRKVEGGAPQDVPEPLPEVEGLGEDDGPAEDDGDDRES